jgi:hypothetical protein
MAVEIACPLRISDPISSDTGSGTVITVRTYLDVWSPVLPGNGGMLRSAALWLTERVRKAIATDT